MSGYAGDGGAHPTRRLAQMAERPKIVRFALPIESTAAGLARERVRAIIDESPLRADLELLLSEVVTNVVKHSGLSPAGSMEVELLISPDVVRVGVTAGGREFPDTLLQPAARGRPTDGGFGLFILDRVAARWGAGPGGSSVWFELERSAQ